MKHAASLLLLLAACHHGAPRTTIAGGAKPSDGDTATPAAVSVAAPGDVFDDVQAHCDAVQDAAMKAYTDAKADQEENAPDCSKPDPRCMGDGDGGVHEPTCALVDSRDVGTPFAAVGVLRETDKTGEGACWLVVRVGASWTRLPETSHECGVFGSRERWRGVTLVDATIANGELTITAHFHAAPFDTVGEDAVDEDFKVQCHEIAGKPSCSRLAQ